MHRSSMRATANAQGRTLWRATIAVVVALILRGPSAVLADDSLPTADEGVGIADGYFADDTVISPSTTTLSGGGSETTFDIPDGTVITTFTPPQDFDPLKADESTLAKYGIPLPPSDKDDYQAWHDAMDAYVWTPPPADDLRIGAKGSYYADTQWGGWGGYSAGALKTQSHTYVAVKANFTVPANSGTCSSANDNGVGFWIGLGGTGGTYDGKNLVQQGIGCGNDFIHAGNGYKAFTEYANVSGVTPIWLCGVDWTLGTGHVIYQNMSFQTSTNKAFFYMEDQTSGLNHSCSQTAPSGWHWDLNTAEWEGEAPLGKAVDFGSVHFTNARAELYSNSTWVSLGSQEVTEWIDGWEFPANGIHYSCIDPGAISSGTAFYDSRASQSQGDCFPF